MSCITGCQTLEEGWTSSFRKQFYMIFAIFVVEGGFLNYT